MVGGLRWLWGVGPTEDFRTVLNCWFDHWAILHLLAARQNQLEICCYSSWMGNRAVGDRWELFSVLLQQSENTQALFLCAGCWIGATKKHEQVLETCPHPMDTFQETHLVRFCHSHLQVVVWSGPKTEGCSAWCAAAEQQWSSAGATSTGCSRSALQLAEARSIPAHGGQQVRPSCPAEPAVHPTEAGWVQPAGKGGWGPAWGGTAQAPCWGSVSCSCRWNICSILNTPEGLTKRCKSSAVLEISSKAASCPGCITEWGQSWAAGLPECFLKAKIAAIWRIPNTCICLMCFPLFAVYLPAWNTLILLSCSWQETFAWTNILLVVLWSGNHPAGALIFVALALSF